MAAAISVLAIASGLGFTTVIRAAPSSTPGGNIRPAPVAIFDRIAEVRRLSAADAKREHPVRIRAVVTGFQSQDGTGYFVMDDSGGIFVVGRPAPEGRDRALQLGQVLEITGVTAPGNYAPQVHEQERTLIGVAPLPAPRPLTYEQMGSGAEDCQFAEIDGVVRSITRTGLLLAMGEGRVDVRCSVHEPAELARVVDARVRLRGVVSGRFNQKRQWSGARLVVSSPEGIDVLKPAPADPFAGPTRAISELLQWELNQAGRHRVKVRGTVTHFQPGSVLFIREEVGLQIRTVETQPLAVGDVVEVLGFPALGTYSAILEDAIFRRVGHEPAPRPLSAPPAQLLQGDYDAGLVSVGAVVLESVRQHGARVLVMQAGNIVFHAKLALEERTEPEMPVAGSLVEVAGICLVAETIGDGARLSPRTFSLVLRSSADIRIVQQPSWWTTQRLAQALALVSCVVLGILSWVELLRRQVRAQTAALKEQMQRETIFGERTRIAQELHDTLDQELTGITLQLNAAVAQLRGEPVGQRLSVVHRLLQRTQSEVRHSVWDLRRPAAESGGLAAALEEAAACHRNGSTAIVELGVEGDAYPLAAVVEHHLSRIAAEAITNAFRHACASRIRINLVYAEGAVTVRIADDGRGFLPAEAPGHTTGHFGLIGMRERSRKIGGELTLRSAPGTGTAIEVRVPAARRAENGAPAKAGVVECV